MILKPDNPRLPGIVENETWCLRMARAIGIDAARARILPAGGRRALCVLRYDRRPDRSGNLHRIHQEDLAHTTGHYPWQKYERSTPPGPGLNALLRVGRVLSAKDSLSHLDQIVFNVLAANTDAHAKNYAILLPPASRPLLAPLYDVSTVLPWPYVTKSYAQNIAGKRRRPVSVAGRHWDTVAQDAGYRPADLRQRVRELADSIAINSVAVSDSVRSMDGATAGYVDQAAALVEEHALRIAGKL